MYAHIHKRTCIYVSYMHRPNVLTVGDADDDDDDVTIAAFEIADDFAEACNRMHNYTDADIKMLPRPRTN